MSKYIEALTNFVNKEYDTQISEVHKVWEKPLPARVVEGEAIADVEVVRVQHPRAWLRCRENLSKFRPGDYLRLNKGIPTQSPYYSCRLEEDRNTELVIRAGYQVNFYNLSTGSGWALDREPVDVRFLILGALDQLENGTPHSQKVLEILQNAARPQFDNPIAKQSKKASQKSNNQKTKKTTKVKLNPDQREALDKALASQNFYLIQGPPGTGKTFTLARLAVALAERGERVLITAFTHRAINNALLKIAKVTGFKNVAKIGQKWRSDGLSWQGGKVPNFEYSASSPLKSNGSGYILGGTCFAVRTKRLRGVDFDTVIFDEAGQIPLPLAAAGMLAGQRYIFIGDHKQMAPVIVAEHKPEWVTRSIFEHLIETNPGTMLSTTYRMNAEINKFPSQRFYDGKVHPSAEAKSRVLRLDSRPGPFKKLLAPSPSSIFLEVKHSGNNMRAPKEARLAAGIVIEALKRGLPRKEIAVVAPYRAQVRLIRNTLQKLGVESGEKGIVIDTVERIQGQERDVIVISLTTSDPGHASQQADFYFQPNRLNVAITRPRVKRIVLGSPRLFNARPTEAKHKRWVEHFRALYKSSHIFRVK
jgi:DNA replication ATP-dependent helicase Dna2